jgi:hypothetical protein
VPVRLTRKYRVPFFSSTYIQPCLDGRNSKLRVRIRICHYISDSPQHAMRIHWSFRKVFCRTPFQLSKTGLGSLPNHWEDDIAIVRRLKQETTFVPDWLFANERIEMAANSGINLGNIITQPFDSPIARRLRMRETTLQ